MKKRWKIKEMPDADEVELLARRAGISPLLCTLLIQRGLTTPGEIEAYLSPRLSDLHDPFLMRDMRQATSRLERALQSGERILVYGDYDVDGATAVALVYRALSRIEGTEGRIGFYIPDRYTEGYGISRQGLEYARAEGYTLVVALDCGIKAVGRMKEAREMGIDFIICDHHVAGDELPDVCACLDPKRPDCPYPDKNLSGCGVGYKLMEALYTDLGINLYELTAYLDMLVVSIASDIVPMTGENRIFAHWGLRQLNSKPCVGLRAVMDVAGVVPGNVDVSDIIFKIGPRINAAGRMKNGADAVRLLIATDAKEAKAMSCQMDFDNDERKDLDREITREALGMIDEAEAAKEGGSIVVYRPTWSKGVIGIVASRLTESYGCPVVVLTKSMADPTMATGSARSVEGFDLYRAIESCAELLEDFGGHTHAAGLTLKLENVEAFEKRFRRYVDLNARESDTAPEIEADMELSLAEVDHNLVADLDLMQPFGPGNPRPVFVTRGVFDYSTSKPFGHRRQHLMLDIIECEGRTVRSGIGFGLGHMYDDVVGAEHPFDVCYTIDRNTYRGRSTTQLMIKDIHID